MPNQVNPSSRGWSLLEAPAAAAKPIASYLHPLENVKNIGQTGLSFVLFIQGIPRAVKLIPAQIDAAAIETMEGLVKFLKPLESVLLTFKTVGNFFEVFEKIGALSKIKAEWIDGKEQNRWKAVYRITSTFYITLESLVLLPYKYLGQPIIAMGQWSLDLGGTLFGLGILKDSLTLISSGINIKAEAKNIDRANRMSAKCAKRLEANGPLAKIKAILSANRMLTSAQLDEVNQLRNEYWGMQFEPGVRKDKAAKRAKAENDLNKARAKLDEAVQKMEAKNIEEHSQTVNSKSEKLERMEVMQEDTTQANLDCFRQVVAYKTAKNQIVRTERELNVDKLKVTQWYEGFKIAVVSCTMGVTLGAVALAPVIGVSAVTVSSVLFLGQWASGLGTGLTSLGKMIATNRFEKAEVELKKLPTTHLLRP